MKKIALFILAALFLFAVGCSNPVPELPSETTQPETTTEEQTTEEETSTEEATTVEEESKVFSYAEIDSKFGPGPFSVNELSAIFGEPVKLFGRIYSLNGDVALIAEFEGISFDLVTGDGEVSFSYDQVHENEQPVTPQDRDVKIEPFMTKITGDRIEFIRGIKIGDSKEKVIAAYDGYAGSEREYEGFIQLFYDYRPDEVIVNTGEEDDEWDVFARTGNVIYWFKENKLVEICITWYNGYLAFD